MTLFDNQPDARARSATPTKAKKRALGSAKRHGESVAAHAARLACPDPACKLKSHPDLLAERREVTERYEDKVRRGKWRGRAFTIKVKP